MPEAASVLPGIPRFFGLQLRKGGSDPHCWISLPGETVLAAGAAGAVRAGEQSVVHRRENCQLSFGESLLGFFPIRVFRV